MIMRLHRVFPALLSLLAAFLFAPVAFAQTPELRGTVRDSAGSAPVSGTVVLALDGIGNTLARTITNARGQYRLTMPNGALLLRAVRIGYRSATERIPLAPAATMTIDLVITAVPSQLQTVEVAGARGCPVRGDRVQASSLLDQARAGLLATVVARERAPAQLVVLRYDRELDLNGIETESQTVRVDSSANATTSFNAVRNAVDFVNGGFRTGSVGQYTYFGPDADVLLDERFQRGYCFTIAARDTARPAQIGLHFAAADSRSGRVDIEGTLWIDTTARALHSINYRYKGVEALAESFEAGGSVSFATLPSGVPFIDRWNMRLVGGADESSGPVQMYSIRESGGELARAKWSDGESWMGPQGTVSLSAVNENGSIARNATLNLAGSDFRGKTDSLGRVTFQNVLPGPYTVAIDDEALAPIAMQLPVGKSFVVARNSTTIARVITPTAVKTFAQRCGAASPTTKSTWLIARVFGSDGKPLAGIHWRTSVEDGGRWKVVSDNGITGTDGLIVACRNIPRDARVEVAVWRDPKDAVRVQRTASELFNVARVVLPTAAAVVAATPKRAENAPTVTAMGTVSDSLTGALISDARVTFVGTPFEGSTDVSGTFLVGGLAPGDYTVEVSTPALDSVGVVTRRTVTLNATPGDALKLFVPSQSAILSSACGVSNAGFVAGTIATRADGKIPPGLRVVAEWEEQLPDSIRTANGTKASRIMWTGGDVSSGGSFRVCGVPAGQRVVLRTESDSATPWNSRPRTLSLFPDRQFARVDLQLDSIEATLGTLVGKVVGDTSGTSLENVEVSITDISRTVYTDRRGNFRITDVPLGPHLVTVKRVGYAAYTSPVELVANRVEDLAVSLNRMTALATVAVEADPLLREFDERKRAGVGRYLTRVELDKNKGRKLGDILNITSGFSAMMGQGGQAYVGAKRAPGHISGGSKIAAGGNSGILSPVVVTKADLENQGFYCPTDQMQRVKAGPSGCSCFAQVYLDGRLLNPENPTEPVDINQYNADDVAGLEFYGSAASTPGRYSNLNAKCGVMLIWTRRFDTPASRGP